MDVKNEKNNTGPATRGYYKLLTVILAACCAGASPVLSSQPQLLPHPPRVADSLLIAADDFVTDVYLNGKRLPNRDYDLLVENFGATMMQVHVSIYPGDWLVFNVSNDRFRWGGASGLAVAGLLRGHTSFTSQINSPLWCSCVNLAQVPAFIANRNSLMARPVVRPRNPYRWVWNSVNGKCNFKNGKIIWAKGRRANVWIKYRVPGPTTQKTSPSIIKLVIHSHPTGPQIVKALRSLPPALKPQLPVKPDSSISGRPFKFVSPLAAAIQHSYAQDILALKKKYDARNTAASTRCKAALLPVLGAAIVAKRPAEAEILLTALDSLKSHATQAAPKLTFPSRAATHAWRTYIMDLALARGDYLASRDTLCRHYRTALRKALSSDINSGSLSEALQIHQVMAQLARDNVSSLQ